jgi:hypothetical protein
MKKLVLMLALFATGVCELSAQIKFGLKIAPQITWSSTESKSITTPSSSVNFGYGLMIDYYFNENYAFASEISVTNYSGSLHAADVEVVRSSGSPTQPNITIKYDYNLRYVNVPLMLRMRTKEIGYFRYFADFGLDNAFLVKGLANVSTPGFDLKDVTINNPDKVDEFKVVTKSSPSITYTDDVSFYRAGYIIGIGTQYNVFGNTLIVGSLRYNSAMTNYTKDDNWKAKMHAVSLNIGILF